MKGTFRRVEKQISTFWGTCIIHLSCSAHTTPPHSPAFSVCPASPESDSMAHITHRLPLVGRSPGKDQLEVGPGTEWGVELGDEGAVLGLGGLGGGGILPSLLRRWLLRCSLCLDSSFQLVPPLGPYHTRSFPASSHLHYGNGSSL